MMKVRISKYIYFIKCAFLYDILDLWWKAYLSYKKVPLSTVVYDSK